MKKNAFITLAVILLLGALVLYRSPVDPNMNERSIEGLDGGKSAVVTNVIDGDTIDVMLESGGRASVRLIGVDTPEIDWDTMKSECYGFEARAFLTDLVKGETVRLEGDDSQPVYDTYDRLLSYVYLPSEDPEDELVNLTLIREGYAQELTVGAGYEYRDAFVAAESRAVEQRRGRFAECVN